MFDGQEPGTYQTTMRIRDCPHCGHRHKVYVASSLGAEEIVYCPQTGVSN